MNILLLDQGNTRIKSAWARKGAVKWIDTLTSPDMSALSVDDLPDRVWVSSVATAPQRLALLESIESHWHCRASSVTIPPYRHHQPTRYDTAQLGVDRWLAVLGCRALDRLPCVVVDCGTAITIDLVDREGIHIGGYILPGLGLMQEALYRGTAIPQREEPLGEPPAVSTASAIGLGSQLAVVALIEQQLDLLGQDAHIFLGGGDARQLSPRLSVTHDIVEQMVLMGLARLAELEET